MVVGVVVEKQEAVNEGRESTLVSSIGFWWIRENVRVRVPGTVGVAEK